MPEEIGETDSGAQGQTLGAQHAPRQTGELDWRARALKAEARVQELERLAAELARKLEAAEAQAAARERARQVERALADTGAIDMETATLLVERDLGSAPSPDIAGAVAELRRRKPYLFGAGPRASAMSGEAGVPVPDSLAAAADEARATGDRSALLRYLRMKRA